MSQEECGWFRRWWHQRLRDIDRRTLFLAIRDRAEMAAAQKYTRFSNPYKVERDFNMMAMIDAYASLPGNGHWRCPCAATDTALPEGR